MTQIDWARLARAVAFYGRGDFGDSTSLHAQYIDVPWWVTPETINLTKPPERRAYTLDLNQKQLVGSAEQSFLYLASKGQLSSDRMYQSITPCFREEPHDALHRKQFMKLELFSYRALLRNAEDDVGAMIENARDFFKLELQCPILEVRAEHWGALASSTTDLCVQVPSGEPSASSSTPNMIELGSYGVRFVRSIGYCAYGTGCAEPRMTMAAAALPPAAPVDAASKSTPGAAKSTPSAATGGTSRLIEVPGYHLTDIPRGVLGQLSKVQEELDEAKDAEAQGVRLMELHELSDLLGAVEAVAERLGSNLDELLKMKDVTKRAFLAGHRKSR